MKTSKRWTTAFSPLILLLAHTVAPLPAYALEFPDAGDRGAPERTAGGGTRGGLCEGGDWTQQSIKALVPNNNVHTFAGDQASLFIYLADGFEHKQAEIYIQNPRSRMPLYQEQMSLSTLAGGGIFQVNIPALTADQQPLFEQEQSYFWEFAVICNPDDRTQDYIVQGLIQPVAMSPEVSTMLTEAPPEQQAELYAQAGIWQETLAIAHTLSPNDSQPWSELLTSVGLDLLVNVPLKDCCRLDPR